MIEARGSVNRFSIIEILWNQAVIATGGEGSCRPDRPGAIFGLSSYGRLKQQFGKAQLDV
jgi:hypothetical protein